MKGQNELKEDEHLYCILHQVLYKDGESCKFCKNEKDKRNDSKDARLEIAISDNEIELS